MLNHRSIDRDADRGAVIPLVALLMVALLTITAIVIDIGFAKQYRHQAQGSADAAALAAAQDLGRSDWQNVAPATVREWANENDIYLTDNDWATCVDATPLAYAPTNTGTGSCVSFNASSSPSRVRVRIPDHRTPAFFGAIVGASGYDVSASAVAQRTAAVGNVGPCGLCIIDNGYLQINNIDRLQVVGGEIWAEKLTVNTNGPASIIAPLPIKWRQGSYQQNQVNGCSTPNKPNSESNWGMNDGAASYCSRYQRITTAVPNPFAAVTVDYSGIPANTGGININTCSEARNKFEPDRMYIQNVKIPKNCTVTLAPGRNYYIAGQLSVEKDATLNLAGGTIIFGCSSGNKSVACTREGGKLDFKGTVNITAPTSGPYSRLAILFDPGNESGTVNQFAGTVTLVGAIYARRAGIHVGNGTLSTWTIVSGSSYLNLLGGTTIIDNSKMGTGGSTGGDAAIELIG